MKGLTTALLGQACRIFLKLAYPAGEHTIPAVKRAYLSLPADRPLEAVLAPPLCQPIPSPEGGVYGYALRLGSSAYPNLKVQVIDCDRNGTLIFGVDTHDAALRVEAADPTYPRCLQIQAANRQLKEQVERAWEAEGLLTFNGLLRRQLNQT